MQIEKLKFPIGIHKPETKFNEQKISQWIQVLKVFPEKLEKLCSSLSNEQLHWRYRPQGWALKQVVHHCADSHMNSLTRFKLALTEPCPTIKGYIEYKWAELPDAMDDNISHSLSLLKGIHARWVVMLQSLTVNQWELEFYHPEHQKNFNLIEMAGFYAWHCEHHLEHINLGAKSKGIYS